MTFLLSKVAAITLVAAVAVNAGARATESAPPEKNTPQKKALAVHQDAAARAFQIHCSRCHNAPETLSPSLTGTVVRHMRVRANLSAEEERLIYSFFNP